MPDEKRLCERCRVEIPAARLEALPETRLCVKCSQEVGGEFETIVVLGSLGKQGSLKKNYGSFTTQKTRNKEAIEKLRDEYQRGREQEKT